MAPWRDAPGKRAVPLLPPLASRPRRRALPVLSYAQRCRGAKAQGRAHGAIVRVVAKIGSGLWPDTVAAGTQPHAPHEHPLRLLSMAVPKSEGLIQERKHLAVRHLNDDAVCTRAAVWPRKGPPPTHTSDIELVSSPDATAARVRAFPYPTLPLHLPALACRPPALRAGPRAGRRGTASTPAPRMLAAHASSQPADACGGWRVRWIPPDSTGRF